MARPANSVDLYKTLQSSTKDTQNINLPPLSSVQIAIAFDPEVDEKLLYHTLSRFGVIQQTPKIVRNPETGNSKVFAYINFNSFKALNAAVVAMNGQKMCNRPISVSYEFIKDSKGERHHGWMAERWVAAHNPLSHGSSIAPSMQMPIQMMPPLLIAIPRPPPTPRPPVPPFPLSARSPPLPPMRTQPPLRSSIGSLNGRMMPPSPRHQNGGYSPNFSNGMAQSVARHPPPKWRPPPKGSQRPPVITGDVRLGERAPSAYNQSC